VSEESVSEALGDGEVLALEVGEAVPEEDVEDVINGEHSSLNSPMALP